MEKAAEKKEYFGAFTDDVKLLKLKAQRGWRLLMIGIVVEVVAALGISVISGLEIADLTDKSAAANLEAKQAGKDAADAKVLAENIGITNAQLVATNLMLAKTIIDLNARQIRFITPEEVTNFIELTKNYPPFPVKIFTEGNEHETMDYAHNVREMLNRAIIFRCTNGDDIIPVYGFQTLYSIGDTNRNLPVSFLSFTNISDINFRHLLMIQKAFHDVGINSGLQIDKHFEFLRSDQWGICIPDRF